MNKKMMLKQMEHFGDLYRSDFLKLDKPDILSFNNLERLSNSWWYALLSFFGVSFLQGRRDELSNKFIKCAKEALNLYFFGDEIAKKWKLKVLCKTVSPEVFLKVKNDCSQTEEMDDFSRMLCEKNVNRERDRKMVLHTLCFVNNLSEYDNNIVSYSKTMISEGKLEDLYRELQKIHSVGPKIASLWIRDLVTIFGLEEFLGSTAKFWEYMFPVDTWVEQFYRFFKEIKEDSPENSINIQKLVADMVDQCKQEALNPSKVNQGIWYSSKHPWIVISECSELNSLKSL